jgi:hypothetical protein
LGGLLPAAAAVMMCFHYYMITPLR